MKPPFASTIVILVMLMRLGVVVTLGASQPWSGRVSESASNSLAETGMRDSGSSSADSRNPYATITDRNVFRLTNLPPPVLPSPDIALPTIKLTGIVKIENQRPRALFASFLKDARECTYSNLAEGERDGTLQLVKISEENESAEILNGGTKIVLSLKDNNKASPPTAPGGPNYRGHPIM